MSEQDSTTEAVISSLLASGFPFQTAVTEVVRKVADWSVLTEEFPWRDDAGADRFLDLVICTAGNLIVTIECKKTKKEIFIFLQPIANFHPTGTNQKSVIRSRSGYLHQIDDSSMRLELHCGEWDIKPASPESGFCVVATSDKGRDQRLLEKDAQLVVGGADAFGRHLTRERKHKLGEPDRIIVPAIVTNAKLFSANYDPKSVSLDTGQFLAHPEILPIEWVRFRKAFNAANLDVGDRTVFVVAAASLETFLRDLDQISAHSPRGTAPVRV